LAPSFHFTTIDCPDTGRPIVVRRTLDAVGQLFVAGQISQHQRDAAESYQTDIEETSGNLRAPSRGPADIGWRSRRPYAGSKASRRVQRVAKDLAPDQAKALQAALAGRRTDIRTLGQALDVVAEVYGMTTRRPTRH
jgi:hypothetical protein